MIDSMQKPVEGSSRRSFLKGSAFVPAAVAAGASTAFGATSTPAAPAGNTLFPAVNTTAWLQQHFLEIVNNENTHLQALLNELGTFARPQPTFQNIKPNNIQNFAAMGSTFCTVGAGAYLGASPYISNPFLLTQAGSLGQVEILQAAWLNSILGEPLLPQGSPFSVPLSLNQVIFMAAPYIASLNGGPAPYFSTDPAERGLQNDIDILNVALMLEYLEHAFYNTYYPVFFPGA